MYRGSIHPNRRDPAKFMLVCLSTFLVLSVYMSLMALKPDWPEARPPEYWTEEKESELLTAITIGMISTAYVALMFVSNYPSSELEIQPICMNEILTPLDSITMRQLKHGIHSTYHHQVKEAAMVSWWTEERRNLVHVFSDSIKPESASIPNTIDTGCNNTYYFGIWCKNSVMIQYWKNEEKFKDVQWFVRVMDDTYLHLENLHHLVNQYDPMDKILLGDMYCVEENYTYPSGGPGFILSRGLLDDWNWDDWMAPLIALDHDGDKFADDVLWGEYLVRRNISITNHMGITQSPYDYGGQLMQYMLGFSAETPWALPFRPVAIHQQKRVDKMAELHKILHSIPYHIEASPLIELPECTCRPLSHQKCSWNHALVDAEVCRWASQSLLCFGPGPWPNLPPEYWHNEDMCA